MLIKQVMARPVPTHPKWKYSLNRESMILFFHKKILYGANVVYAEGWQQSKKRMAYSTIFPAILYRMKCPYSPANYLKGDYEVRAVTMKYNPQIEMFARFKMKSSFHKTKRII